MKPDVFLMGGGEMGELIRKKDWTKTPLGNPANWPQSLLLHTKTLLDNKLGMYIAWGPDYTQIYNDAYRPILGSTKHPDALGNSSKNTFTEIWNIIGPMFEKVMKGESVGFPDFMLPLDRNGDGKLEECFFDFSYSPIYHEDGYVGGILVTVIETTEQVKSIKKLFQSETNLRNLVLNAPVGICVLKGKDFVVEIANAAMLELWGTTNEIVIGKPVFEALPLGRGQGIEPNLDYVFDTGVSFSGKNSMKIERQGIKEKIYVNYSYDPFKDQDGNIIGIIAVAIDVTKQVEAKKEVEESEANLKRLIMNAPVAMCVLKEPDYKVEIANDLMLEIWGTTRSHIMQKAIFDSLPEAKEQGLEQLLLGVYTTGVSFSAQELPVVLRRNGKMETVYLNFSYDAFRNNKGEITGILAVAIEVTKLVESRHKIEDAEERSRLAIESANIGTYDLDLKANKIITSSRFNEIFGLSEGSPIEDYRNTYHPEDRHIRDKAFNQGLEDGSLTFQLRLLLKDGIVKWVRLHGTVYKDAEGKPERLVGTALDISTMVEIQRQKDDFIAIASHELKTPLTSIKAYNQILSALIKQGDEVTSLNIIKKTERQIQKMIKLIHNFLDLSKLESAQLKLVKEDFDLNDLVSETINYYNIPENKERLRFEKTALPKIHADRLKISHVIDNLLSNALKYSGSKDQVLVKTSILGKSVMVSVTDTGKGINESSKEKIFQRFYRADNTSGGTISGFGIGLYFSSEIIKLHDGSIGFDSIESKGSTFYFELPIP